MASCSDLGSGLSNSGFIRVEIQDSGFSSQGLNGSRGCFRGVGL